ncbi:MAG: hypothetical protein JO202_14765 [Ktedonobacteraceae bacterium]|nr:hypothetical protein [Ktedonobacteraceae bacterium]
MQKIVASQPCLASQRITVTPLTHRDCPFTPLGCNVGATPVSALWHKAFSIDGGLPFLLEEYAPRQGHHAERMKSSEEMI